MSIFMTRDHSAPGGAGAPEEPELRYHTLLRGKRVAASLFVPLAVLCTTASAQVTLNTSVWMPHSHLLVADITVPLCADIERVTEKRVKCNILPMPVAGPAQTFDAVRNGVADLSFIVDGYTPGRFVASKVAEFPFVGTTGEINSVAYNRIYERLLAQSEEHKGVKVLAVFTHGPAQIHTATRPITKLKDIEGLKIRTGGGLVNETISAIGGTAMMTSAPEVYELMSSRIIDGFVLPKETSSSMNLTPFVKYVTEVPGGISNAAFSFIMNPAKWERIAATDQAAMQELFGEALARRGGRAWDAADIKSEVEMKAAGVEFQLASPQLVEEITKRTEPLEEAWYQEAKAKGIDGESALEALRAEVKAMASSN